MVASSGVGREVRTPSRTEIRSVLLDARHGRDQPSAAARGDANSIGFLINADGSWLQLGTLEADDCIAEALAARPHQPIEASGFVTTEFSRSVVRVSLDPSTVGAPALASLRPRLAVIELPVELIVHGTVRPTETYATGALAMARIGALVKARRELMGERFEGPLPLLGRQPIGMPTIGTGSYVVADDGEWFKETDPRLARLIGLADPNVDAIGYAVRNMGFVRVSFSGPGSVTVAFHPRNHEKKAVATTTERLEAMTGLSRIELRHLAADGWQCETLPSAAAATRRIRELCGIAPTVRPEDRWHLTAATPAMLSKDDNDPLRLMHQKWRISFGTFTESFFSFAMRHQLLDRFVLASTKRGADDLVFRYIGDGLGSFYSEEFRFNAIGTSIAQQPDKDYGAWVAEAYKSVALTSTPRLDYIDAHLPVSSRGPWVRYERLLLPWKLPSGESLVSMTSRIKADRMLRRPA